MEPYDREAEAAKAEQQQPREPTASVDFAARTAHRGSVMGARLRRSLAALLTGLFALAIVVAPTAHARAVIGKALFVAAYAMPDGTLPDICGHAGAPVEHHGQHRSAPACLACIIMAAPGLPDVPPAIAGRVMPAGVAPALHDRTVEGRQVAWARQPARAPPAGSIA